MTDVPPPPGNDDATRRLADAHAAKAEADARAAQSAADKAERENADWNDEANRRERAAKSEQSIAEAEKAAGDARRSEITALVPDLTAVEKGETTFTGDRPMFSSVLAHRALTQAVAVLVEAIPATAGWRILITDDPDLVTSDASYVEVGTGLAQLTAAANALLLPAAAAPGGDLADAAAPGGDLADAAAPAVLSAIAAAVPGVLSLLAARRSIRSAPMTVDTAATTALTAGRLAAKSAHVTIDEFRLVPDGRIVALETELRIKRSLLVQDRSTRDAERSAVDATRAVAQSRADALTKRIDGAAAGVDTEANEATLARVRQEIAELTRQHRDLAARIALLDDLITAVAGFTTAMHTVPSGANRSPFTIAALREGLRATPANTPFTHVLFVQATTGSVDQLFTDAPLWSKDRFHAIGSVSVAYWLLDPATSEIVTGGVATGTAQLKGKVGDSFTITSTTG